jgi:hypothetical protein
VQYFGHRHICIRCKEFIKSPEGMPVKVMLDADENIRAIATDDKGRMYEVNYQDLRIFDKTCFASFAGEDEMILLVRDKG